MKDSGTDIKALAKIAKGTGRKKRDICELEVARELNSLYEEHRSLAKVAAIVKLHPEMVRQIKSLLTLVSEVQDLYRCGQLKGYDIGHRISKLRKKDQITLARYVVNHGLSSDDVRAIVTYRINNPELRMREVISRVLESKDKRIYVVYLVIGENTFRTLSDKIKGRSEQKAVRSMFSGVVSNDLVAFFELKGRVVTMKVHKEGLKRLRTGAKELGVRLADLADALARKHLKGCK